MSRAPSEIEELDFVKTAQILLINKPPIDTNAPRREQTLCQSMLACFPVGPINENRYICVSGAALYPAYGASLFGIG